MEIVIFSLLIMSVLAIIIIALKIALNIDYNVHKSMTKSSCNNYGKCNFEKFKEYFYSIEWEYNFIYPDSIFSNNSKIHASMIVINGDGMIMSNAYEYYKFKKFINNYIKTNYRQGVNW